MTKTKASEPVDWKSIIAKAQANSELAPVELEARLAAPEQPLAVAALVRPTRVNQLTGKEMFTGPPPRYPLATMQVGEKYVVERKDNSNPTYDSIRIYLYKRGRELSRKFRIYADQFPNLIIERIQ